MSTTIITRRCSKINYFKIDPNSMYCALLYQLSSSFQQIRPLVDWRSEAYITVNIFEKKVFFCSSCSVYRNCVYNTHQIRPKSKADQKNWHKSVCLFENRAHTHSCSFRDCSEGHYGIVKGP